MRAASLCLLVLAIGCGKSAEAPAQSGGAAGADSSEAGAPPEETGAGAGGASSGAGGANAGATATGGASNGGTTATGGAGGSSSAGANSTLVDCDPAKVMCKKAAPECKFGTAPEVVDGCYGECVNVMRCACSSASQCPDPNQYTCWSKTHCGPFVN
jgi:hypothetical protein